MSRKDRRRVLMIALPPELLAAVRRRAADRRGLGDTMRLMVAEAIGLPLGEMPAAPDPAPGSRRLALQLPPPLRRRLAERAAETGLDPAEIVRRCVCASAFRQGGDTPDRP